MAAAAASAVVGSTAAYLKSLNFNGYSLDHPLIQQSADYYDWSLTYQHPMSKDFYLMNPLHCVGLIFGYLFTVWLLVQLMKFRSTGFSMYYIALMHNLVLTGLSLYMGVEIVRQAWINNYSIFGNAVQSPPGGTAMSHVLWIFYASKVLEFGDTILMALKKNNRQITFLHLYHHGSIFFIWWMVIYYGPGGEAYFSAMLNSFVHVFMYGYYLWATFARKLKDGERPSIFHPGYYRPYITKIQLTQFVLDFIQASYDIFYLGPAGCKYPLWLVWILFYYMITMLGLFANFYRQAYSEKSKQKKDSKKKQK